jgi:broad specificity phosphatase PhoE
MSAPVLYYMRHGETDWNVEGRLQGRHDIPLNAVGRRQATACGSILAALVARDGHALARLDFVSSPLSRARETMELMRTAVALEANSYRVDAQLTEISFGAWEGLTLAEVRGREPASLAERERDKWHFVQPGGESYQQLSRRMRNWYAELTADAVVVAHGGTARALLVALGVATPREAPNMPIDQGVVYRLAAGSIALHR